MKLLIRFKRFIYRLFGVDIDDVINFRNKKKIVLKLNEIKVKGIYNLGNTCYLSVLLQLLGSSKIFVSYISNDHQENGFVKELYHFLKQIRNGSDKQNVHNPNKILNSIKKEINQGLIGQQDTHEIFNTIITIVSDVNRFQQMSLSDSLAPKRSLITTMENPFTGFMCSQLTCQTCMRQKPQKHETFTSISLPIPTTTTTTTTTLDDCLNTFVAEEVLHDVECLHCSFQKTRSHLNNRIKAYNSLGKVEKSKEVEQSIEQINQYFITGETDSYIENDIEQNFLSNPNIPSTFLLKVKTNHTKRIFLSRLPKVLCFMLQRKIINTITGHIVKCNRFVSFPMELDMSPPNSKGKYILQSVIVHEGNDNAGHYSIFTRTDGSNDWKWISDSNVENVDNILSIFKHIKAYMLIYKFI